MTAKKVYTLKIAGRAGQGIKSAGVLYARFLSRSGYHIYNYIEFPSIIRGGHNVMQINVSTEEVTGPSNNIDALIALNQESITMHKDELNEGAVVIYDEEKKIDASECGKGVHVCPLPLSKLSKQAGDSNILINTVALGAITGLWDGDLQVLFDLLEEEYGDKGEEVVKADQEAAKLGYDYVREKYPDCVQENIKSRKKDHEQIVINGNQSVALGAIHAGVQFACIYPMSPISGILQVLALHQEEFGYVYKQPEDEISAINMALGASFAGARSMTATSGGGFCLMSEAYGLAGITETPLVIVEGMRGGPGTGLPTWSSQGDLQFILHAHQDDFPRIVLAPGDAQETFHMTMEAFNIAEKYQTPVVVLIDKNICDNDQTFKPYDVSDYKVDRGDMVWEKQEDYKRYKLSENGISPRSVAGSGNFFVANSDEHDEYGLSSEEIQNRNDQMQKRMKKMDTCANEDMKAPTMYGPEDADLTIVSWGSNKGSIVQAIKDYDNVNYMHITWVNPLPGEEIMKTVENAKNVVFVECSYSGQMAEWIRSQTGVNFEDKLLKYDGRPIYVEEIKDKIDSVLKGGN